MTVPAVPPLTVARQALIAASATVRQPPLRLSRSNDRKLRARLRPVAGPAVRSRAGRGGVLAPGAGAALPVRHRRDHRPVGPLARAPAYDPGRDCRLLL